MRAHPRERRLRRLLPRVAELPGHGQSPLSRVGGRLEEEDVAAAGGERQARRDAGVGGALAHLAFEAAWAEPAANAALVDAQDLGASLPLGDLPRSFAEDVGKPPLEVSHARLARVLADDQPQRAVRDRDLVGREAVSL